VAISSKVPKVKVISSAAPGWFYNITKNGVQVELSFQIQAALPLYVLDRQFFPPVIYSVSIVVDLVNSIFSFRSSIVVTRAGTQRRCPSQLEPVVNLKDLLG